MSGGPMRMIRARGSRSTASSSLMISALSRVHISGEPLLRIARGQREKDRALEEQHGDVAQKERPNVAGEEDGLQARDQIARGDDEGDPLDDPRHRVDLEEEAREEETRQESGEERHLRG